MQLRSHEQSVAGGADGPAAAMAMRIVAEAGRLLGAADLLEIASVHVDGCLYHGDAGVRFVEGLVSDGGRVAVPTTLMSKVPTGSFWQSGRQFLAARWKTTSTPPKSGAISFERMSSL